MHPRRFDGSGDWPAPAAVIHVSGTSAPYRPTIALLRALVLLAVVAFVLAALSLAAEAHALALPVSHAGLIR